MSTVQLQGSISPGFEGVADAFLENFAHRGDVAASCTIYRDAAPVVDIWAGSTDLGPWDPATRTVVFSVSKGVTTICLLMAVEQGLIDLDAPVAVHWPEFARNGKEEVTVRQVMAHRAGLPAPTEDITREMLRQWTPVVDQLAEQAPSWTPGEAHLYHALTFGHLAGEVLRRATGLRPNEWLQQVINPALGLGLRFGSTADASDMIPLLPALPADAGSFDDDLLAVLNDPQVQRAMTLGSAFEGAELFTALTAPDLVAAELPAANLTATARDLARLYAATVGEVDGVRLLTEDTVRDATRVQSSGVPFVGPDMGSRWGTGFMLDSPARPMAGPGGFGHDGMGGQLAFADPAHHVSFAYHTARPSEDPQDGRAEALCTALRDAIA
ncbi:serine hydrolase domain-containing protein [Brachybacterium sp. AOP43-C2-M15]|uniref:serine hydrolase domain-containing protein n=1 Tax=Brachybacterium sp. AOP43-C2-M15 TaxID=3457661 RepID=UPI0040333261